MSETSLVKSESKVIQRMSNAWRALKKIGPFAHEVKSAPDMGQAYPYSDNFDRQSVISGYHWRRSLDVDYHRELGDLDCHSLVMAVCNYTGTRLPEAKPTVLKKDKDGKLQPDLLHPLARLIRRPNNLYTWANYALTLSASWWIVGDNYFLMDRDITGTVQQLWLMPTFLMRPRWYGDGRAPEVPQFNAQGEESSTILSHYQYNVPGKSPVLYPEKDVLHIRRGCDPLTRTGVSGFKPLVKELYGDDKMAAFTAAIMTNMGIQVPIIRPKDGNVGIAPDDAAHMKQSWMQKTTGQAAGEPVILTEPVDIDKFGFSPTELDLSKLRMIPESRVAAVLGIPAPTLGLLVGLQNGTSYASSEQARQQGYEEVVIPMQQAIAAEIQWQLLPEFEDPENAEFEFDTSKVRVLQEDQDALMKRAATGYLAGILKRSWAIELSKIGKDVTPDDDVFFDPRGGSLVKEGEDPNAVTGANAPVKFGSVADIEKYLGYLESEMKDFVVKE